MLIEFCIENLNRTQAGSVDGDIWLHADGVDFPDKNWFDYPVAFLSYFSEVVLQLYEREITNASVSFMDGPYEIELTNTDDKNKEWIIQFIEDRSERSVVYTTKVEVGVLMEQLIKVLEKLMGILQDMDWKDDDSKRITSNLKKLKAIV